MTYPRVVTASKAPTTRPLSSHLATTGTIMSAEFVPVRKVLSFLPGFRTRHLFDLTGTGVHAGTAARPLP